jgi:hypothetical protein
MIHAKRMSIVPDFYICPINQEIMTDPVFADDGYTYERSAISAWFNENNTSPMTREKISKRLVTNNMLRSEISNSGHLLTHITNNTNTNNIIVQITPYNNSYNNPNLDEKYFLHAITRICMSVPTLIKHIHFNKNRPENHNIVINNLRTKIAIVYDGHEWKTKDEDELLVELIDTYEKLLEDWAYGDPEKMIYLDEYLEIKDRDGIEDVHKNVKENIKILIYENRDMVNYTIRNQMSL